MATTVHNPGVTDFGTPNGGDSIYVTGGNAIMDTNLDWSGVAGIALLNVAPAFTGTIGSSSSPFIAYATLLDYEGGGGYIFFESETGQTSAEVRCAGNGTVYLVGSGTITDLYVTSGTVDIGTGVTVTNLYVYGGRVTIRDDSSPTLVNLYMIGPSALATLSRVTTNIYHGSGSLIINSKSKAIAAMNVYGSGVRIVRSGTVTAGNLYGGFPDVDGLQSPLTFTASKYNKSLPGIDKFLNHKNITISAPDPIL